MPLSAWVRPDREIQNGQWVNASLNTFSSELYADAAIKFIETNASNDNPFLMYVAFTSPHDPRNVLPDYGRKYDSKEITMPKNFITQHPFDNGDLNERDENCCLLRVYRNRYLPKEPTITAWWTR